MQRIAIAIAVALLGVISGCGSRPEAKPEAKREVLLAAGTEVQLVLLRQISAGSTREGTLVPFMVAEDVKAEDGSVAIEKGTIAEGEVTWSRSEGTLSGLMNQPARLAVKITRTRGAGGESVALVANRDKPEEAYAFTRENTGIDEARISSEAMVQLSDTEIAKKLEAAIDGFLETGDASKLNLEAESKAWLDKLTQQGSLRALDESMAKGTSELERVAKHVRDGTITKLAGAEVMLAVSAMKELARLGAGISNGLLRGLKGRTIKAHVGAEAKAFVAQETKVKVEA
jgi:hypothetical protein